eukprot:4727806-Alexandrium_andersonii.AAC.1
MVLAHAADPAPRGRAPLAGLLCQFVPGHPPGRAPCPADARCVLGGHRGGLRPLPLPVPRGGLPLAGPAPYGAPLD